MPSALEKELQTRIIENSQEPGSSAIYRNGLMPDDLIHSFDPENVKTVYDLFKVGLQLSPDQYCLGRRTYDPVAEKRGDIMWQTYTEVSQRIDHVGSGLIHVIENYTTDITKTSKRIGIWAPNRPEWTITDMACASQGLCNVALYETLGPDAVEYVIQHAELELIVCTSNYLTRLLKLKDAKIPLLKAIVLMDGTLSDATEQQPDQMHKGDIIREWAAEKDITLFDFSQVEDFGKIYHKDHDYPSTDDVFCIMYTSGTTGVPKGVMLTHGNFVAAVSAAKILFKTDESVVGISYLPLAHCFGRIYEMTMLASGGKLGYISDGIDTLFEDCQMFQPTFFGAVPRLLTKIYGFLAQSSIYAGGMTGIVSRMAVNLKLRQLAKGGGCTHALWDRLLFNKMKQLLGGRVSVIASGAAPMSHDVLQFLRVALCCDIREGYGATETTATGCLQRMGDNTAGSVGGPYVCTEIKLVDVPEMDDCKTETKPPKGEICMRGPSVFKGYFKDQAQTDQVLDKDGWYHSGDIGTFDKEGSLTIVDRKKNIFKLAQGEYIAPEKIENVFVKDPMVSQIFVYGEPLKSSLVAVVVPDANEFESIAKQTLGMKQFEITEPAELYQDEKIKLTVLKRMMKAGKAGGLQSYEIPKAIFVESVPFSIQNDLLTPSLKIKRYQAKKYYEKQLEKMYSSLE